MGNGVVQTVLSSLVLIQLAFGWGMKIDAYMLIVFCNCIIFNELVACGLNQQKYLINCIARKIHSVYPIWGVKLLIIIFCSFFLMKESHLSGLLQLCLISSSYLMGVCLSDHDMKHLDLQLRFFIMISRFFIMISVTVIFTRLL